MNIRITRSFLNLGVSFGVCFSLNIPYPERQRQTAVFVVTTAAFVTRDFPRRHVGFNNVIGKRRVGDVIKSKMAECVKFAFIQF